jgi:hypothetical protein
MKRNPPLTIWLFFVVLFLIIQAVIYFVPPNKFDLGISYPRNDSVILKNNANKPAHKIIIIGSSITDEAVDKEEAILSMSNEQGVSPVLIKKVTGVTDKLALMINRFDLVNYIIKEQPEAVCIQSEFAAVKFSPEHVFAPDILVQLAQENKVLLKKMINGFETDTSKLYWLNNELIIVKDTLSFRALNRSIKTKKEIQYVIDFIKTLKNNGIKIYFLDIPRAKQFEQLTFTSGYKDSIKHLFNLYNRETGTKRIQYTGTAMFFNYYRDIGGHMNVTGRKLYTTWLIKTLQNELKR